VQRPAFWVALGLLALLLCFLAAGSGKQEAPLPEKAAESPSYPGKDDDYYLAEKKELRRRDPGHPSPGAGEQPGLKEPSAEVKESESEPAASDERPVEPEDGPRAGERPPVPKLPGEGKESIHFLLTGRWWEEESVEVVMVVTLVPRRCARLAALDPETAVKLNGRSCPLGELLKRGGSRDQLYTAVRSLTGLTPRFHIDFNLHGFVEMVALMAEAGYGATAPCSCEAASPGESSLDGHAFLQMLNDDTVPAAAKERNLVELLLASSKIQFTPLGLKLLWMGYHNLKTDLTLKDLLELRKVSQEIAPTDIIYVEVKP